ncbi:MAG: PAS domain S-box protein [Alphaproteobacteria bacterium]|nr:PAS domain S-box protein [Alphaproteobacteria bacterium]MCW5743980.1 PAS domain S-box protein [Alphaproteobacteria bacterium]
MPARPATAPTDALPRLLFETLSDCAVLTLDAHGRVLGWNDGGRALMGFTAEEVVGQPVASLYVAEDVAAGKPQALLAEAAARGRLETTLRRRRKDGTSFAARVTLMPLRDPHDGALLGFGEVVREAPEPTPLRRIAEAVQETMIDALVVTDAAGTIRVCNSACERMFGYARGELIGHNVKRLMPSPTREAHDGHLRRYGETGRRSLVGSPRELVGQRKDGTPLPVTVAIGEAMLDGERIFVGVIHDLSERKAAEAGLNRARRLESIGQLTGGVAHDFNNILMVIIATAEALADELAHEPARLEPIERILGSAERAADLTRQLLAFARRQPLSPAPTRLNDIVAETGRMIGRTLGEHIEIEARLDEDLWVAHVDRAQLESALLNLCINARDAMPEGGTLSIVTRNAVLDEEYARGHPGVTPGEYVMLAVSDTGIGIPASALDRVFEPFFTTKETGKGTGLGLSMVYGFVRQSGGHVAIYSEEGHGTTIRLYLPRIVTPTDQPAPPAVEAPAGGGERILVVEDDAQVRSIVAGHLRGLGYEVEEAADGQQALALLAHGAPCDLLLSDVVMPGGMGGKALAEKARQRQPGLRVLFVSGYAHDAMVRNGRLDRDVRLLSKPFRRVDLARAVRAALDEKMPEAV